MKLKLTDGKEYDVCASFNNGTRCIINYDGLFVLVDQDPSTGLFDLSGEPARGAEADAMKALLDGSGTLDTTVVTVTKD